MLNQKQNFIPEMTGYGTIPEQEFPVPEYQGRRDYTPGMPEGIGKERMFEFGKYLEGQKAAAPDFAFTVHAATREMSEQDRMNYMRQFRDRMAQRLERYEWRKARGADLSPQQEQVYKDLLQKVQTLNQLMESPEEMTQYMEGAGALIGQRLGVQYESKIPEPRGGYLRMPEGY